jgi:hypothetical protein
MDKNKKSKKYPDGRGKRPKETNKLAKWILEESTKNHSSNTPNAENTSK